MHRVLLLASVAGCATGARPTPTPPPVPHGRVVGIVTDAKGHAVERAGLTLTLDVGDDVAVSDDAGRFAFDRVPVGRHHLRVSTAQQRNTELDVVVATGDTVTVAPVIDTANLEIPFGDGGIVLDRTTRVLGRAGPVAIDCGTVRLDAPGWCPGSRELRCRGDQRSIRAEHVHISDPTRHCVSVKLVRLWLPGNEATATVGIAFDGAVPSFDFGPIYNQSRSAARTSSETRRVE